MMVIVNRQTRIQCGQSVEYEKTMETHIQPLSAIDRHCQQVYVPPLNNTRLRHSNAIRLVAVGQKQSGILSGRLVLEIAIRGLLSVDTTKNKGKK